MLDAVTIQILPSVFATANLPVQDLPTPVTTA